MGNRELLEAELGRAEEVMQMLLRADSIRDEYKRELGQLKSEREKKTKLIEKEMRNIEVARKSLEVLKVVIEDYTEGSLKEIERLVTSGLGLIFEGRQLEFKIEVGDYGATKTATFYIKEGEDPFREITDVGMGVRSIVSMLQRIYFIKQMNKQPFLIMDEAMTKIATAYVDSFFSFLKEVIESFGLDVLFVTQDSRFVSYGDVVYEVAQGGIVTEISETRAKLVAKQGTIVQEKDV